MSNTFVCLYWPFVSGFSEPSPFKVYWEKYRYLLGLIHGNAENILENYVLTGNDPWSESYGEIIGKTYWEIPKMKSIWEFLNIKFCAANFIPGLSKVKGILEKILSITMVSAYILLGISQTTFNGLSPGVRLLTVHGKNYPQFLD